MLIIPVYDEEPDFLEQLNSLCHVQKVLVIVIINQPTKNPDCLRNEQLWQHIQTNYHCISQHHNLSLHNFAQSNLLVVDRFQAPLRIDSQQGVGLARKIGCDIAAYLIDQEKITSDWIHTTDADAKLPGDYFEQCRSLGNASAAIYRFIHAGEDSPLSHATTLYEQSLNYYVAGLRFAQSPYAFHTIGSCIAVTAKAYCQVRGFPKRAGGEDFYLLNKIAKVGNVVELTGRAIEIKTRASARTPFGTGPAVAKILANPQGFTTYNPEVFVELRRLLRHLHNWWSERPTYQTWEQQLTSACRNACHSIGIVQLFRHLQHQATGEVSASKHINAWFDGFRTLKFIHSLQTHHYPPVPLATALERAKSLFNGEVF